MREDIDIRHQGSPEERGLGAHCTRALVWQEAAAQRLNSSRTTQSRVLTVPAIVSSPINCSWGGMFESPSKVNKFLCAQSHVESL